MALPLLSGCVQPPTATPAAEALPVLGPADGVAGCPRGAPAQWPIDLGAVDGRAGYSTWRADPLSHIPPPPPTEDADLELAQLQDLARTRTEAQVAHALAVEAEPVTAQWTRLLLQMVTEHDTSDGKGSPPRQARKMAILETVMWDTLVVTLQAQACYRRPAPAQTDPSLAALFVDEARASYPSLHAAVASAAATTLASLYPAEAGRFEPLAREIGESRMVAGVARQSDIDAAWALGDAIAREALAQRRADGSDELVVPPPRPAGSCAWQETPPDYGTALDTDWGHVTPFLLPSGDALRPPAPLDCDSEAYVAQVRALYDASLSLTTEQRAAAHRWAGSPPLQWLGLGLEAVLAADLGSIETSRLMAHLAVALADAGIIAWDTKYAYWTERPFDAVRRLVDPEWAPPVATPPFPGYVSGHATFSAASAHVLGVFLPEERARFDSLAAEARDSRFWGGIHLAQDNEVGFAMGGELGRLVAARAFPSTGSTQSS